jgi:predicted methyltransferase
VAGIKAGQRVAELMAGEGFYAEILARAVGPAGRVVAQNNARSHARYGAQLAARLARLDEEGSAPPGPSASIASATLARSAGSAGSAVSRVAPIESRVVELDRLDLAPGSFDAIFLVQFYHDTFWMDVDRAAMNEGVFEALVPGGVFVVIDHAAGPGAGASAVETLHRIERETVEREVEAAGFRLVERSSLLESPLDDHTRNVFDPEIRGRTDRFLLRFERPVGQD